MGDTGDTKISRHHPSQILCFNGRNWVSQPRGQLGVVPPCRTQLYHCLFPWWLWSFLEDEGFSLSTRRRSQGEKNHTTTIVFFPQNEPTYLFQVSYVVQQDIYHLSLKHLPIGHSVCSEISQKVHFHFFPCMRDCFKHQFQFAPLQPPGVQEMRDTIKLTPHGDSSQWFLPIDSSWLYFLGHISTNILCVLTLLHKIQIQNLLKSSCCVALNLFFKGMVKSKSWLSLLTQYPMYKGRWQCQSGHMQRCLKRKWVLEKVWRFCV